MDCVKHVTTVGGTEPHIYIHDNARSHTAATMDFLRRWQLEILEHPPYSPDMIQCDCDLFSKVKEPLKGTMGGSPADIRENPVR